MYVPEAQGGLPPGTTYSTYWVRVPASGVGYVPCTVAPQVATKLDAKLSQFSMPEDLHRLLDPRALLASHPDMLAGPIFTSVPPVQGGTDAAFLGAVQQQEEE